MGQTFPGPSKRLFRLSSALGAACLGAAGLSLGAWAGELTVTPSVSVVTSYSDNIDLDPEGLEEDALVTEVTPGFELRSEGGRSTLALDAANAFRYQSGGEDEGVEVAPSAAGTGTVELSRDLLFLDASTSVSQELLDSSAASSESNLNTTAAYSVSPYLTGHTMDYGEGELRYTFGQVFVDEDQSQAFSDDTSHEGRLTLESGDAFGRTSATFFARAGHTERSDDPDIQRGDVDLELEHALFRSFSVIGGGGYQVFDDGDRENEVNGPTWRGGFRLHNPRGEVRATYGRRDDDNSLEAMARYRVGAFTTVDGSYSKRLETGQERLREDLSFISVDPDTGILIDTRTGLPFDPNSGRSSLTNQTTRTERLTAGVTFNRGRNQIGIRGGLEDQQDQSSNDDESSKFITVFWERRLSRKTTLLLSGSFERSTFDLEGRKDNEYIATGVLSHDVRENVTVFGSYTYRNQTSTAPTDEYSENRGTVGMRVTF